MFHQAKQYQVPYLERLKTTWGGARPWYEVATLAIVMAFASTKTIQLASDQVILSYLKERNNKNYIAHLL